MRTLVVGGAGYIGSHVAKLLHRSGHEPILLDNLSSGHRDAAKYGVFYEASYQDAKAVEEILRKHRIETVMHFGAKALVGESVVDPLLYYDANVSGTVSLLQAMRAAQVRNFVFSSTCATFGEPTEVPIHERVDQKPVNPYGMSKLFVEKILQDCDRAYGIKHIVLRYFNAAGSDPEGELGEDHRPETHLIPKILSAALNSEAKLTVHGKDYNTPDGTCVRDYVHVNDLADAHIRAMEYLAKTGESCDLNLGSERGSSVLEVLKMAEKVTKKEIPYTIGARRPGDPPVLIADSSKAQKLLSWKLKYSLEQIVEHAFVWFKKNPKGYAK